MGTDYFHKMTASTPTRFWVNNPNADDMEKSLNAGAINCTTNPAYCSKLLKNDPGYIHGVIDRVIATTDDDDVAADLPHRPLVNWVDTNRGDSFIAVGLSEWIL